MLRLIVILSLFLCSQAYGQQFYVGTQVGYFRNYELSIGIERDSTGNTFGVRIALGSNVTSSIDRFFTARLDGYGRLALVPDSRSGFYFGFGLGFLSMPVTTDLPNFQYLIPSAFLGLRLELAPPVALLIEAGIGVPFEIGIPTTDSGSRLLGLLAAYLSTIRLDIGLNFYF